MKINLAENMLRFGAKNLTESSKQKLVQLAEQETPGTTDLKTVDVKPKGENKLSDGSAFNVGNTIPPDPKFFNATSKIYYYNIADQSLYFYSSATDNDPMKLSVDGTFNLNTAIDFVIDLGKKSYGMPLPKQSEVANIIKSLQTIQQRLAKVPRPGSGEIINQIKSITSLLYPYGNKDAQTIKMISGKEFKGKKYTDQRYLWEFAIGLYIWLGKTGPEFNFSNSKPTTDVEAPPRVANTPTSPGVTPPRQ